MSKKNEYLFLNGLDTLLQSHEQYDQFLKIRKAVQDGNPYAMRDLIVSEVYRGPVQETKEFAKAIVSFLLEEDDGYNPRRVLQYVSHSIDDPYIKNVARWLIYWNQRITLDDHFSRGQMMSKIWLVEHLQYYMDYLHENGKTVTNIVQYGGWYATVAWFILRDHRIKQYLSLDVDDNCVQIADSFNENDYVNSWRFKAVTHDVNKIEWTDRKFDINAYNAVGNAVPITVGPQMVINTSCEHMTDDWFNALPEDMPVCLQTNDYFANEQHINCVSSIDEVLEKYKFKNVSFSGELDTGLYKRFMVIGRKC